MTATRPNHYHTSDGKDLLSHMADIFSPAEYRGFMKGNVLKYTVRYDQKNGVEDLDKAAEYIRRLREFELKETQKRQKNGFSQFFEALGQCAKRMADSIGIGFSNLAKKGDAHDEE